MAQQHGSDPPMTDDQHVAVVALGLKQGVNAGDGTPLQIPGGLPAGPRTFLWLLEEGIHRLVEVHDRQEIE